MINIVRIVPIMLLNSLFHIDTHTHTHTHIYIHMAKKVIDYWNLLKAFQGCCYIIHKTWLYGSFQTTMQCVFFPKIKILVIYSRQIYVIVRMNNFFFLLLINLFAGDWYEYVWTKTINYSSNWKIIKILKSSNIRSSIPKKKVGGAGGGRLLEVDKNIKCTRW